MCYSNCSSVVRKAYAIMLRRGWSYTVPVEVEVKEKPAEGMMVILMTHYVSYKRFC